MVDITHKGITLRTAVAQAIVRVGSEETLTAIKEDRVPKGNVLAMAKAAGFLGVKKTPALLPDCHPLPIEFTAVDYEFKELELHINMTVKTLYKTGVEVEAMHGASVVALTIYDMLKPIDKAVSIHEIKLLEKTGGKSSHRKRLSRKVKAAVVVCSDSISQGDKEDKAGKAIVAQLNEHGLEEIDYQIIPDEADKITEVLDQARGAGCQLVIYTGGTGLSPRDVTPDTLEPLLERRIPGMEEAIRAYGQERTPYAMLSRSMVGTIGNTLIMALPGSTKGAQESMQAVFPAALHLFNVMGGERHD
ncbi:bifunctional molybdenum cofactor biosynthesis protein MoaC/MoaB [Gilvibacter sediminis]|uniref:bifunctional molybdenum cofactor biosynthesis protein MoaC/MoaB n=1 Tax=Gilvibacter sediminis TaxID=379071 RepID=UPI00235041B5|nr:bifunctional molybdenum cofactor biosynthesis protein MoaC/MoaB [Gilvibacter sediminis]MDC7996935.1 bifunctional molybdenum cofactor biosynthesis protein MoaC/MoaB [Gilvibacter sediminis]